eukprot:scaffold101592_cov17-Tisochrysis_lutea.AAC.1
MCCHVPQHAAPPRPKNKKSKRNIGEKRGAPPDAAFPRPTPFWCAPYAWPPSPSAPRPHHARAPQPAGCNVSDHSAYSQEIMYYKAWKWRTTASMAVIRALHICSIILSHNTT